MVEYTEDNVLERPVPYQVLRSIHLSDGGTYAAQLNLKAGIDENEASEIIAVLEKSGFVYRVDNTDPQLYDVNYSYFVEAWSSLWEAETGFRPDVPVNFGTFLENYCNSYLGSEEASTISEMLVHDFFLGLGRAVEHRVPANFEGLFHELSEEYDGKKPVFKHVQNGFNSVD